MPRSIELYSPETYQAHTKSALAVQVAIHSTSTSPSHPLITLPQALVQTKRIHESSSGLSTFTPTTTKDAPIVQIARLSSIPGSVSSDAFNADQMLNHRSHTMQSPNKLCPPTIVVTAPSSFEDTLSTSANIGSVPHNSATSKLHVNMIDDEDCDHLAYIKSLGPKFRGVEDLVTHPKADDGGFGLLNDMASSSLNSDFDYEGEYKDYEYTHGILEGMGVGCEELSAWPYTHTYFRTEMPDGSKIIMAKFHDYAKQYTGRPAFQGHKVSDEVQQHFMDLACDVSNYKPHLHLLARKFEPVVDEEEPRLNIGCFEYPRQFPAVWNEDFDEIPLPLGEERVVVGLVRSGNQRKIVYETMKVRNDMPGDPMVYSSCQKGIEAARALAEYQEDDEQIQQATPIPESDRPCFEGGLRLDDVPKAKWDHLHAFPGENDGFVQGILDRLEKLRAQPERYDHLVANDSHEYAAGSILGDRKGLEENMIVGLWNDLYDQEECDTEALREQGLLNPEDDFGDNPEYRKAKKIWWEQKMGIRGTEAIVRYHMEHVRSRRRPNRAAYFLTEEDDAILNKNSPEYPASRAKPGKVPDGYQFYDELHDSPVGWTAKSGCWIRPWRLSVTNTIPHDDFDEECREAYDALVEYQDSREPGCEAHKEPEQFARPLLAGRRVPTMAALERKRSDSGVQLDSITGPVGLTAGFNCAPGKIPAALPVVNRSASVLKATARTSGGLMEHLLTVRDDEETGPADAVANAPSPKFLKAFLEKKKNRSAPSSKFLRAFLEKKAFGGAVKSSIQIPPGILADYSAVEDEIRDQDSGIPCNLIQHNAPGPVPIPGRVWVRSSNPEMSRDQRREQQVTVPDGIALTRPRNDAENRLMNSLHLPVSKADPMHRPRRR
ncbi:hypothetical protein J4E83_004362 [Alternaria metachromatica]|uniref:uncharacterized protein n=1 Tax=Alternaria metachromatica TaxID=283354 RepID=UPI0020C1D921|nr:uncharacterized protein J4E83_004362 [Alternaria metachromatica]KAI4624686.1 hypothetical protein J4E83_004362 [Alternaria metachromatica]